MTCRKFRRRWDVELIVADAGLAEASLLDQWLFVAFAFAPWVLGALALSIGVVIASRSEMPPEDCGEKKPPGRVDEV